MPSGVAHFSPLDRGHTHIQMLSCLMPSSPSSAHCSRLSLSSRLVWPDNVLEITAVMRPPGGAPRQSLRSSKSGNRTPRFALRGRASRLACRLDRALSLQERRHAATDLDQRTFSSMPPKGIPAQHDCHRGSQQDGQEDEDRRNIVRGASEALKTKVSPACAR